jgi:cytochrome c553
MSFPGASRGVRRLLLVPALLLAALGITAGTAHGAAPDPAAPVPEAALVCTVCHGTALAGNRALGAPRLAGLPAWYLRRQLEAFRQDWRGGHPDDLAGNLMRAQAQALAAEDVAPVVAYAASLPRPAASPGPPPSAALLRRGRDQYGACAACHGDDGSGEATLQAPPLVGRDSWYLERQLHKFRRGERGYEPADHAGTRMRVASSLLEDEQAVRAVVTYLGSLAPLAGASVPPVPTAPEENAMIKPRTAAGAAAALSLSLGLAGPADAEVRRHKLPDSDFPIAQAVEVLRGTTLVYHSGMVPAPADPEAERFSPAYWGDTETQTLSVFRRLEASLAAKGLTFGDVVKMQVFLVAPEPGGAMDFAGMMRAYRQFFGTEAQPNLPARSAFQVAGLAAPGMLVEIEVVLARP